MDFHLGLLHVPPSVDEDEACCIGWAHEHAGLESDVATGRHVALDK